ncbi:MAG: hypothetical protein PHN82_11870 [bacterium]|nr:hypothetical protein [bacterium]
MARPLRIQYEGAWYHVTSRGNEKAAIFRDDHDRSRFLGLLEDKVRQSGVEVHCHCLMKNHFKEQGAQRILGREGFIEWVYDEHVEGRPDEREYSRMYEIAPCITTGEVAAEVARVFQAREKDLFRRYSRGVARRVFMELCYRLMSPRMTLRRIAAEVLASPPGLIINRRRLNAALLRDRRLARKVDAVQRALLNR